MPIPDEDEIERETPLEEQSEIDLDDSEFLDSMNEDGDLSGDDDDDENGDDE